MARSVPLFTPRAGGGSAFFVRPLDHNTNMYLDELQELRRLSEGNGSGEYIVLGPISADLATSIIIRLPPDARLMFHDPFFPSPSDPGAYVSVMQHRGQYIYMLGNHGWQSEWERQSREFLTQYLALCLPVHCPPDGSEHLSISPVRPADVAKIFNPYADNLLKHDT